MDIALVVAIIGAAIPALAYFGVQPDTLIRFVFGLLAIIGGVVVVIVFLAMMVTARSGPESTQRGPSGDPPNAKKPGAPPGDTTIQLKREAASPPGESNAPPEETTYLRGMSTRPTTDETSSEVASDYLGLYELTGLKDDTKPAYSSPYNRVTTNDRSLHVRVPAEWADTDTNLWRFERRVLVGTSVIASTNIERWSGLRASGASFRVSSEVLQRHTIEEVLNEVNLGRWCDDVARGTYQGHPYIITYDLWGGCGKRETHFLQLVAVPESNKYVIKTGVVIVSEADVKATYKMLRTLEVDTGRLAQE